MSLFKASVLVAYGTGGMKGPNGQTHQYWSGNGRAFGKSPKNALKQAWKLADAQCGDGASWCCVYLSVVIVDAITNKVIYTGD